MTFQAFLPPGVSRLEDKQALITILPLAHFIDTYAFDEVPFDKNTAWPETRNGLPRMFCAN